MMQQQDLNSLAGDWVEQTRKEREQFIEDCSFAKVVSTFHGDALLIGGHIIEIKSAGAHHAEWMASALRSTSSETREGSS